MREKLEQKINQQFVKLVDELDLGWYNKQERDWKMIGTGLAAGLLLPLAPITVPLVTAYAVFGSKHYSETMAGLAIAAGLALGPILLPFRAVEELVNPESKPYLHLRKENSIVIENHSSLPAVYFGGTRQKFSFMEIYFSSGDAGIVPNPDSDKVPNHWNYQRALNRTKYDQAAYFLNISKGVNDEMNQLLEERAGRSN